MKQTLKKLLWRNIVANFKQFLFVIAIVFLSVTLLSGFLVNSKTLRSAVDNYFADTNLADVWVYVSGVSAQDEAFFEENNLEFDKRLEFSAVAGVAEKTASNTAKIFVYDEGSVSTPFIYSTIKGCWIDKNVAKNHGLVPGQDRLLFEFDYPVSLGGGMQVLKLKFNLLITGTMCLSEQADTYSSWPVLVDKDLFLNELNKAANAEISSIMPDITLPKLTSVPYNQVLFKTDDVGGLKALLETHYSQQSDSEFVMMHGRELVQSVVLLDSEANQAEKMIYIFPLIFLLVSLLVIVTTIGQLILQEKQKIGTLKSLGATNKMLTRHYSSYGAVLCLIGAALGLAVGPWLIPEIMFIKYDLVYSLPQEYVKISLPFGWLAAMLAGVVLMGWLTALIVCKDIVTKKPAWCLKSNIKVNLKPKKHRQTRLTLPMKMSLRNLTIKPFKTAMAVVGVAGCVALLLCGFGISDTLNHSLDNDLKNLFSFDISSEYNSHDFVSKLENFDKIEDYEFYEKYVAEVASDDKSKTTNIYKVSENSKFMSQKLLVGEVAISKSVASDIGKAAGECFELVSNGKKQSFLVTKVIETAFFNGVYICGDVEIDQSLGTRGVWIKASGDLGQLADELNDINGTNSAQTMAEIRSGAEEKIASIGVMTTTLKTFAILLAVVVLLNLVFLILKERVREIATLKVLGHGIFMVASAICLEILFISCVGGAIGMILGFPLLVWVLSVNKVAIVNFLYYISPASFVFAAILILLATLAAMLICVLKVRRVSMIDSLKSVE